LKDLSPEKIFPHSLASPLLKRGEIPFITKAKGLPICFFYSSGKLAKRYFRRSQQDFQRFEKTKERKQEAIYAKNTLVDRSLFT
jgi:hypothetical protein